MSRQLLPILLILFLTNSYAMFSIDESSSATEPQKESENINRVLFIFLDDSEYRGSTYGAIMGTFLNAFLSQAGPIIVSASILNNIKNWQKLSKTDIQKLYDEGFEDLDLVSKEMKNIVLSTVFSVSTIQEAFQSWIIKEINSSLYLLMPKSYLKTIGIDEQSVQLTTSKDQITEIEQMLGLKVNHMRTISSIDHITSWYSRQRILSTIFENFGRHRHYFMQSIWDDYKKTSAVFVTRNNYFDLKNKKIPSWSIYLTGHGNIRSLVADLALIDFKEFLSFLETKINTKLLYYATCYGAGTNNQLIYKDAEEAIEKTYSYTIITEALTDDVVTAFNEVTVGFESLAPVLTIQRNQFYNRFAQETMKDVPDYHNFINARKIKSKNLLSTKTPQIKYPGLPWFSIIDNDSIVSIGSILAKNRTAPLDIEKFFQRKGKKNNDILGILLYAKDVPFEIVINFINSTNNLPEIISMLPGDQTHHIKKISTTNWQFAVLNSFIKISDIGVKKIFIIDQLSGKDGIITNVVIQLIPGKDAVAYWTKDSHVFKRTRSTDWDENKKKKAVTEDATDADKLIYYSILNSDKPVDVLKSVSPQITESLQQNLGSWSHKAQQSASSFYTKNIAPVASKIAAWFALKKTNQPQPVTAK